MGAGCVEEVEAALWEGEEEAALEPLERLCDEDNDAFSCFRLAVLYEEGSGGQKDIRKAAHYFERACELDNEEGCERRFELAARQADTEAELDYAKKACEGGRPLGCMASAAILNEGRVGARDKEQAVELYEKACGVGDADGCAMAGDLLFDPKGTTLDKARALTAYSSACVGYSGRGCLQLAVCFFEGIGAPQNIDKARTHFKDACELGIEDGCHNAKRLAGSSRSLQLTTQAETMTERRIVARDLSCLSSQYGESGLRSSLGAVARHRRALNECIKDGHGAAVGIRWTFKNGRIREVRGNGKGTKRYVGCVAKALRKKGAPGSGKCSAVLLLGDAELADAAYPIKPKVEEPAPAAAPTGGKNSGRSGRSGVVTVD